MATEFKLPEVGEGIDAGTVVAVLVSVGDRIEVDQETSRWALVALQRMLDLPGA